MSSNNSSSNLCRRFARILESEILTSTDGLCAVTRMRNIKATIEGIRTESPLVLNALFSFESMDCKGKTLNLGETVILQEEINPFISELRREGIEVTALHNHWLFDKPRLFYIHFFSIDDPIDFANKVARAFEILEDCDRRKHSDNHKDYDRSYDYNDDDYMIY
ncbi:hypothetical protein DUF1259 [Gottschalkia acidurici 9a]|uniref:DUF1259 domain-containing protein n=1 Tax=Gottschalkia acidurici (strain ATCC 7906 / DSM 604 / BCRC 14475 / CIP 104303 / KCTC 5404 / NCIMB 10678 / 9a) TaxID=1128398 RepID=K0AYN1_GOTA9|nr:DUF1259 domain-containing protein [Gottschalkia acidurici]AFS78364.1 hypothetical protein DUF1259 [Gottschalkia acidurici 9a]